jgi:hypothetical protein
MMAQSNNMNKNLALGRTNRSRLESILVFLSDSGLNGWMNIKSGAVFLKLPRVKDVYTSDPCASSGIHPPGVPVSPQ